jgi:phosphoglycolate phosphatase
MKSYFTCVLFDMDGTLLDSAAGITESAAHALKSVGALVPTPDELLKFVGRPMIESFLEVSQLDEFTAQVSLRCYRSVYAATEASNSSVFDGVTEVLGDLTAAGYPLAIATSKQEDLAIQFSKLVGISHHFVEICGASEADGRLSKVDVIAETLRRLKHSGVDVTRPVMVGDRKHDQARLSMEYQPSVRGGVTEERLRLPRRPESRKPLQTSSGTFPGTSGWASSTRKCE